MRMTFSFQTMANSGVFSPSIRIVKWYKRDPGIGGGGGGGVPTPQTSQPCFTAAHKHSLKLFAGQDWMPASILKKGKLRHQAVKQLEQHHPDSQWSEQELHPQRHLWLQSALLKLKIPAQLPKSCPPLSQLYSGYVLVFQTPFVFPESNNPLQTQFLSVL